MAFLASAGSGDFAWPCPGLPTPPSTTDAPTRLHLPPPPTPDAQTRLRLQRRQTLPPSPDAPPSPPTPVAPPRLRLHRRPKCLHRRPMPDDRRHRRASTDAPPPMPVAPPRLRLHRRSTRHHLRLHRRPPRLRFAGRGLVVVVLGDSDPDPHGSWFADTVLDFAPARGYRCPACHTVNFASSHIRPRPPPSTPPAMELEAGAVLSPTSRLSREIQIAIACELRKIFSWSYCATWWVPLAVLWGPQLQRVVYAVLSDSLMRMRAWLLAKISVFKWAQVGPVDDNQAMQPVVLVISAVTSQLLLRRYFDEFASTWVFGLRLKHLWQRLQNHPSVVRIISPQWLFRPSLNRRCARSVHPGARVFACVYPPPADLSSVVP